MMIAVALLIRLDGSGPIFHRQVRVGRNGIPFVMYKFRTMRVDSDWDGAPRWAADVDSGTTQIGALIRSMHIDEIPQVLNVIKGHMSFVGPRPERPTFVDSVSREIPQYNARHQVRPGLTGWAQTNYEYDASGEDAKVKLSYDLYYAKNRSIRLDLAILLRTIKLVLFH